MGVAGTEIEGVAGTEVAGEGSSELANIAGVESEGDISLEPLGLDRPEGTLIRSVPRAGRLNPAIFAHITEADVFCGAIATATITSGARI